MGDYHVDRLEVYAQQCVQLTSTNRPKAFLSKTEPKLSLSEKYCGGYSSVDPPLPIPNREVKHTNADGTAPPGGRVGRCRFSDARLIKFSRASLLFHHLTESRHFGGGLTDHLGSVSSSASLRTPAFCVGSCLAKTQRLNLYHSLFADTCC